MFNDYNGSREPDTYINGFSFMSNDALSAFINDNELSFSLEQMIYIRDYFRNEKKMFPTYNQMSFFNEINKIRKSQKKGYSIYSVTSTEGAEAILESSKDLLSKKKAIKKTFYGAMPLSFAAEIASEYLKKIDCAENSKNFLPASSDYSSEYYIHTDDDLPLFVYSNGNQTAQGPSKSAIIHNSLVMLCPTEDIEYSDYFDRVNSFLSLPEISTMISKQSTISAPYGIFDALSKEIGGVFVNLSNIPEIQKNENGKVEYLSLLLTSCIGRRIFATSSSSVGIINRIAECYSLKAFIFGTRNYSRTLSFDSIKNPTFSFEFDFLQRIMNFTDHREYIFSNEINAPLGARKNVYLTDNRNMIRQTYRAERILNFGKITACAVARELDTSPHKSAAFAIIDAINTLVAKGISKNAITLSIHYSLLCGNEDSRELGKNLSAILGAYRSMIELCVSDTTPQISYTEKKRNIVVIASANSPKKTIGSNFSSGNTHLYFYQINTLESGLPNYENYRSFIKYFYSLIEKDNVLSAFSINENISTVLKNASSEACIKFDEAFDLNSFGNSHGIIFETSETIPSNSNVYYVGSTSEKE